MTSNIWSLTLHDAWHFGVEHRSLDRPGQLDRKITVGPQPALQDVADEFMGFGESRLSGDRKLKEGLTMARGVPMDWVRDPRKAAAAVSRTTDQPSIRSLGAAAIVRPPVDENGKGQEIFP